MRLKNILNESELKGYLAADVVDDIVKSIGSKFVKGYIENAPNKNYIYLKLTDIKFGNDVVKMLKSKFGIDAKIDKTFGNIPSVSFASKKVISESVNESLSSDIKNAKNLLKDPHTITDIQYKQTRRGDKYIQINYKKNYVAGKMYDPEGQFVSIFYEDDKDLTLIGKELKLKLKESVNEKSDDVFSDYSSSKGKTKGRSFSVDRVVKDGKYSFEYDDNDGTVRLSYNGKPISYGFIDWSTGGFIMIHSSWNNKDKSFQFTKDIIQYFKSKKLTTESVTEGKYYIGYNKGRGQGTGVFKDVFSTYKDAKKEVEKIEKQRGGSYNQIAYYVADEKGNFVREAMLGEGRGIKSIQNDLDKTVVAIESEIASYKATKGTPQEKKHIDNLKKLHPIKKKLQSELDMAVSGLYRDAELKIED